MHVKMHLKCIAQVAWEHGRNFHKLPIDKTKNSSQDIINKYNLPEHPNPHFLTMKNISPKTWSKYSIQKFKCRQIISLRN